LSRGREKMRQAGKKGFILLLLLVTEVSDGIRKKGSRISANKWFLRGNGLEAPRYTSKVVTW